MPELQRLGAGHAPAVLAFELASRAYFAAFISDRGDAFFDEFTERYRALLAEQEAGICVFHVLVGEDRLAAVGARPVPQIHYWQANGGVTYEDPDGCEVVFASWIYTPPGS